MFIWSSLLFLLLLILRIFATSNSSIARITLELMLWWPCTQLKSVYYLFENAKVILLITLVFYFFLQLKFLFCYFKPAHLNSKTTSIQMVQFSFESSIKSLSHSLNSVFRIMELCKHFTYELIKVGVHCPSFVPFQKDSNSWQI